MSGDDNQQSIFENSDSCRVNAKQGTPLYARLLRLATILVFLVSVVGVLSPLYALLLAMAIGCNSIYISTWGFLLASITSAVLAFAAIIVARWLGSRYYAPLSPDEEPSRFILGTIVLGGALVWVEGSALSFIAPVGGMVAFIGSLFMLWLFGAFRWKVYLAVLLGCGLAFAPSGGDGFLNASLRGHTYNRQRSFEAILGSWAAGFSMKDIDNASRSIKQIPSGESVQRGLLILATEKVEGSDLYKLRVSLVEAFLDPRWLASAPSDLETLIVIGPFVQESSYFENAHGVSPVMIYHWPKKELIGIGRLQTVGMGFNAKLAADYLAKMLSGTMPY